MSVTGIWETIFLFLLGLGGWALFSRLRLPIAPFLGALAIIVTVRAVEADIPLTPSWLFPLLQVLFGIYVGSMVTRKNVQNLKLMMAPAVIIVLWAQSIVFVMGPLLARLTTLDLYTSLLSLSMAGVAEITIIALDVEADLGFIIIMQMTRIITTMSLFPLIYKKWMGDPNNTNEPSREAGNSNSSLSAGVNSSHGINRIDSLKKRIHSHKLILIKLPGAGKGKTLGTFIRHKLSGCISNNYQSIGRVLLVFLVAVGGGIIFHSLGVPAGIMVGAMLAIAFTTLLGVQPVTIPPLIINLMLVGMGISVADNILLERLAELYDPRLLLAVVVSIILIFISSFLVALLVHRISGWDLSTCVIASAPAGFIEMIALAVKYDKDPFFVSMMLLCRMLSLKLIVPFVFMSFM